MTKDEMRKALLESTVEILAKHGFSGATTKAIASVHGLNEAYIYRIFGGKEKLFAATFEMLDNELVSTIRASKIVADATEGVSNSLRAVFDRVWHFVLERQDRCLAYVRYYFSPYFMQLSHAGHMAAYKPIIAALQPFFREGADVTSLAHHVLSSLLDFAVRVHNGDIRDSKDTETHVFRVLFYVFHPYLRDTEF
jgi:AcrR family transcriptional regulator